MNLWYVIIKKNEENVLCFFATSKVVVKVTNAVNSYAVTLTRRDSNGIAKTESR